MSCLHLFLLNKLLEVKGLEILFHMNHLYTETQPKV